MNTLTDKFINGYFHIDPIRNCIRILKDNKTHNIIIHSIYIDVLFIQFILNSELFSTFLHE